MADAGQLRAGDTLTAGTATTPGATWPWDLATPRYDYSSAAAAEQAYEALASRRPGLPALLPVIAGLAATLLGLQSVYGDTGDQHARELLDFFGPLYGAGALLWLAVAPLQWGRIRHARTIVMPAPGRDAAAWYRTTVANVVREGRLVLRGAVAGAVVVAVLGSVGVVLLVRRSGTGWWWDDALTVLLPAAVVLGGTAMSARRCIRRPEDQLRHRPAEKSGRFLLVGMVAVTVGVIIALTGDVVPGYRTYTDFENGIGSPAVEFPVVVARLWWLPFLGGLVGAAGWALVATGPGRRPRSGVLVVAAVATVWIAAVGNPMTRDGLAYLWFGAVPALLAVLAGYARRRAAADRR